MGEERPLVSLLPLGNLHREVIWCGWLEADGSVCVLLSIPVPHPSGRNPGGTRVLAWIAHQASGPPMLQRSRVSATQKPGERSRVSEKPGVKRSRVQEKPGVTGKEAGWEGSRVSATVKQKSRVSEAGFHEAGCHHEAGCQPPSGSGSRVSRQPGVRNR